MQFLAAPRVPVVTSLPGSGNVGELVYHDGSFYRWTGAAWDQFVNSVAGKTGTVDLAKGDVGLGNVDNTSDLSKPISTATQAALDLKFNASEVGTFGLSLIGTPNSASATDLLDTFTLTNKGLVPAPAAINGRYLKDDGTWAEIVVPDLPDGFEPIVTVGTGASQDINLPVANLTADDLLVTFEGILQDPSDLTVTGSVLTLTAPATSSVVVRQLVIGASKTVEGSTGSSRQTPQMVQYGTLRGDGNITLPSPPTPGNLLVVVMAGHRDTTLIPNYMPIGFMGIQTFRSDINNAIAVGMKRVEQGEPTSWAMSASDNQSAVIYEFSNSSRVIALGGGTMAANFTSSTFSINLGLPLYGQGGIVLGAFTSDQTPHWSVNSAPGLSVDFLSPPSATDNHPAAFVRYSDDFSGIVTGSVSANPVQPAFGLFEVVGTYVNGGSGTGGSSVINFAELQFTVSSATNGDYIRTTNAGEKTVVIEPNSNHSLPINGEWHFRNTGVGNLTFAPGSGVTVNPPFGGSLIVPQGGTVTLKRVGIDEFDLLGQTES